MSSRFAVSEPPPQMIERTRSPIFFRRGCRSTSSCTRSRPDRLHPGDVALDRRDLAVVAERPERLRAAPGGGGVRAVAAVEEDEARGEVLVAQVGVEPPDLRQLREPLVDDGAVREARDREVGADLLAQHLVEGEAEQVAARRASRPRSAPSGGGRGPGAPPARSGARRRPEAAPRGRSARRPSRARRPRPARRAPRRASRSGGAGRRPRAGRTCRAPRRAGRSDGRGRESGRGGAARGCRAGAPPRARGRRGGRTAGTGRARSRPGAAPRPPGARRGSPSRTRRVRRRLRGVHVGRRPPSYEPARIETMPPRSMAGVRISRHAADARPFVIPRSFGRSRATRNPPAPVIPRSFGRVGRRGIRRRPSFRGAPVASGDEESAGLVIPRSFGRVGRRGIRRRCHSEEPRPRRATRNPPALSFRGASAASGDEESAGAGARLRIPRATAAAPSE